MDYFINSENYKYIKNYITQEKQKEKQQKIKYLKSRYEKQYFPSKHNCEHCDKKYVRYVSTIDDIEAFIEYFCFYCFENGSFKFIPLEKFEKIFNEKIHKYKKIVSFIEIQE